MDGVGSTIKRVIKDTVAFHPNTVINNSKQLLKYLKIDDIIIGTYKYDDVTYIRSVLPNKFDIIISGYGLAKVHEIHFSKEDNNIIKWKKISDSSLYLSATIKVKESLKKKYVSFWYTVIVNSIIIYLSIDLLYLVLFI